MGSKCYVLNLQGVEFWQKKNSSNGIVYRKNKILKNIKLYFYRFINSDGKLCYMDYITGSIITFEEDDNYVTFKPTKISICKRNIQKVKLDEVKDEISNIIDNDKQLEKYSKISEEFLYYSYFCELISKKQKSKEIPKDIVEKRLFMYSLKNKTKILHK